MPRTLSLEEARDEKIAELTTERCQAWTQRLRAGDERATTDLQNCVLDRLSESEAKAIFVLAVTEPAAANARFTALVAKVMRDECEIDAIRDVEWIEKNRKAEADEARVDVHLLNRSFAAAVLGA